MSAPIHTQEVAGETLIDLGYLVLVASKSEPGAWHEVRDGACTCDGFKWRHHCRHLDAVQQAQQQPCFRCGNLTDRMVHGIAMCPACTVALTSLDD